MKQRPPLITLMALDQERTSFHLLSRLDPLDFMMKRLGGKGASMAEGEERGNGGRRESGERESKLMPMDLALQETLFKGSLLDRVASLETRLFQLCSDMDYERDPHLLLRTPMNANNLRLIPAPAPAIRKKVMESKEKGRL